MKRSEWSESTTDEVAQKRAAGRKRRNDEAAREAEIRRRRLRQIVQGDGYRLERPEFYAELLGVCTRTIRRDIHTLVMAGDAVIAAATARLQLQYIAQEMRSVRKPRRKPSDAKKEFARKVESGEIDLDNDEWKPLRLSEKSAFKLQKRKCP